MKKDEKCMKIILRIKNSRIRYATKNTISRENLFFEKIIYNVQ